jgi:hypothetical protein
MLLKGKRFIFENLSCMTVIKTGNYLCLSFGDLHWLNFSFRKDFCLVPLSFQLPFLFCVLRIEPRALCMPGKDSVTWPMPQIVPLKFPTRPVCMDHWSRMIFPISFFLIYENVKNIITRNLSSFGLPDFTWEGPELTKECKYYMPLAQIFMLPPWIIFSHLSFWRDSIIGLFHCCYLIYKSGLFF